MKFLIFTSLLIILSAQATEVVVEQDEIKWSKLLKLIHEEMSVRLT